MNLTPTIHQLEVVALLVPFVALSILVLLATFGVAWKAGRRKR